jgi:hypothetical protein
MEQYSPLIKTAVSIFLLFKVGWRIGVRVMLRVGLGLGVRGVPFNPPTQPVGRYYSLDSKN